MKLEFPVRGRPSAPDFPLGHDMYEIAVVVDGIELGCVFIQPDDDRQGFEIVFCVEGTEKELSFYIRQQLKVVEDL